MNKICGFIALVFAVLFYGVSHAQMVNDGGGTPGILTTGTQEGDAVWYPHGLSGQEGTGIHFEVNDTDGRTVVLDSSEPVTLKLDSYPRLWSPARLPCAATRRPLDPSLRTGQKLQAMCRLPVAAKRVKSRRRLDARRATAGAPGPQSWHQRPSRHSWPHPALSGHSEQQRRRSDCTPNDAVTPARRASTLTNASRALTGHRSRRECRHAAQTATPTGIITYATARTTSPSRTAGAFMASSFVGNDGIGDADNVPALDWLRYPSHGQVF